MLYTYVQRSSDGYKYLTAVDDRMKLNFTREMGISPLLICLHLDP